MAKEAVGRVAGNDLARVLPQNAKPWWKTPHLIKLNILIFTLLLFSSTIGYDTSLMNGLQSLDRWQIFMNHPTGSWLGFISAIQSLGALVGLPFQASAANRFGRKPCILFGYFFIILGVGIQVGAHNPAMFIASRFLIGHAGAWFSAAIVLVTEIAYPTHRSKLSAMYHTQYYIGASLAAWTVFGCRNMDSEWAWKIPALLQIAFPVVALPFVFFCPESPRWLISKDRLEEARMILVTHHSGGDESAPLVAFQVEEISRSIALERDSQNSASWADMVKTRGNRHRFFVSMSLGVFAQWNGVGIVSYYLSIILKTIGITSVTEQTLINGFLQVWNLVAAMIGSLLVDYAGRRTLFLLSTSIMLVSYIIITGLSGSFATTATSSVGTAVIPFLFIYYGGYDIAFTPLVMAYPAEIWGYSLRAKGLAFTASCTYIALLFNQFVNPIALDAIAWKYYILYICLLIVIFITIYFTYPETRGHTLEEIAVVFDGEEAVVPKEEDILREEKDAKDSIEKNEYVVEKV